MKSLFEEHFQSLAEAYPGSDYDPRPDGARRIRVPGITLPPTGWNMLATTVYFVTSPSYPMAQPDCFWTDPNLRLTSGAMPQNTSVNNSHGFPENLLWFSWHTSKWDPNRDNLLTYVKVIARRLQEPR
jgi:Prokaryotic E2 family E